jgi:hypothetical protein
MSSSSYLHGGNDGWLNRRKQRGASSIANSKCGAKYQMAGSHRGSGGRK